MSVEDTLKNRELHYGDFKVTAQIADALKDAMRGTTGWASLNNAQRESLDLIATKIGRVLNKGANFADNWHDIAGYATLVENDIAQREKMSAQSGCFIPMNHIPMRDFGIHPLYKDDYVHPQFKRISDKVVADPKASPKRARPRFVTQDGRAVAAWEVYGTGDWWYFFDDSGFMHGRFASYPFAATGKAAARINKCECECCQKYKEDRYGAQAVS